MYQLVRVCRLINGERGWKQNYIGSRGLFMQYHCFACSLCIFNAASIALLFGKLSSFADIWSSLPGNIHHFLVNVLFENFHTDILSVWLFIPVLSLICFFQYCFLNHLFTVNVFFFNSIQWIQCGYMLQKIM